MAEGGKMKFFGGMSFLQNSAAWSGVAFFAALFISLGGITKPAEYAAKADGPIPYETRTAAGLPPVLPGSVVFNGSQFDAPTPSLVKNGYEFGEAFDSRLIPVQWDMGSFSASDYAAGKVGTSFEVRGTAHYNENTYPAKAIVYVNAPQKAAASNTSVTFENIKLTDEFWAPKQKINAIASLNKAILEIEKASGGGPNFDNAIKKLNGQTYSAFSGFVFQDSDIYKLLEAVACTLFQINGTTDPALAAQKAVLESMLESWVKKIEQVQYADGYINTFFTLRGASYSGGSAAATHRFINMANHELYCAGHFFEAAVAYTRYREGIGRPDYRLYVAAKRFADTIVNLFGPDGVRVDVPGHEEIELGLAKIAKIVEEHEGTSTGGKYMQTAKTFIDRRGHTSGRTADYGYATGEYSQDHVPFVQQTKVVGHSVRAAYLYAGATDVALWMPDGADKDAYVRALDTISNNVITAKTYVTGGYGLQAYNEGFGSDYELPNDSSYLEVCAAIAFANWNGRMNLLHEDAKYMDEVERSLYNAMLVGVNVEGTRFFYNSRLQHNNGGSGKTSMVHRSEWFGCACCPPNLMRALAQISGYMYTVNGDNLFVNMFICSEGHANIGGERVGLRQKTQYPWDGAVAITVDPPKTKAFAMNIRIPGWVSKQSDTKAKIKINGKETKVEAVKGYVGLKRVWKRGDVVSIEMPMEVRYTEDAKVATNANRAAVERGPIVYAFEQAGNGSDNPNDYVITKTGKATVTKNATLFPNGYSCILTVPTLSGGKQAIPYFLWNNRSNGTSVVTNSRSTYLTVWTQIARSEPMSDGFAEITGTATSCCQHSDAHGAANATDGDNSTHWHSNWANSAEANDSTISHWIQLDLGSNKTVSQIRYMPRQSGGYNGNCAKYEVYASASAIMTSGHGAPNASALVARGEWRINEEHNLGKYHTASFPPGSYRYVLLRFISSGSGDAEAMAGANAWKPNNYASCAEFRAAANPNFAYDASALAPAIASAQAHVAANPAEDTTELKDAILLAQSYGAAGKVSQETVEHLVHLLRNKGLFLKSFTPTALWLDTSGKPIRAHGGGVMFDPVSKRYFWYGEDRRWGHEPAPGIHAYSSQDLYNWRDEGIVLPIFNNTAYRTWANRDTWQAYVDTVEAGTNDGALLAGTNYDLYVADSDASADPKPAHSAEKLAQLNGMYSGLTAAQKKAMYVFFNRSTIIERPKVIYNASTGKYVCWFHNEGGGFRVGYTNARTAVAVADSPTGPFRFIKAMRVAYRDGAYPESNGMARDMGLLQDDDGKAYLFVSSEENKTTVISQLTDDYLDLVAKGNMGAVNSAEGWRRTMPDKWREAPAPFKANNVYYSLTSGTEGWMSTLADVAHAPSPLGDYTMTATPCVGEEDANGSNGYKKYPHAFQNQRMVNGAVAITKQARTTAEYTFGGQGTFVMPVVDRATGKKIPGKFIAMFDVWNPAYHPDTRRFMLNDSRYIWLPLELKARPNGCPVTVRYRDEWSLESMDN
jgi:DUF1680 family protein